jgi:hypothetical protein
MVDTQETASAFGMRVCPRVTNDSDLSAATDFDPHCVNMDRMIDTWLPLTFVVDSRSIAVWASQTSSRFELAPLLEKNSRALIPSLACRVLRELLRCRTLAGR